MTTDATTVVAVRWIARVWSILSIGFVLFFMVGDLEIYFRGVKLPSPTMQEWVGLILWPIGVVVGLIVAWFREELGGILAVGSLIAFYVWNVAHSGHLPRGPFFFLVAAPGLLFLAAGLLSRRSAGREI